MKNMATLLCERCGQTFTDHGTYKQHKTDHQLGKIADKTAEDLARELGGLDPLVPPIPNPKPTQPDAPQPKPKNKPTAPWQQADTLEQRKKSAITLVYRYEGYCPKCAGNLETIELDDVADDKKKVVVIAWCGECKKKLRQTIVSKL